MVAKQKQRDSKPWDGGKFEANSVELSAERFVENPSQYFKKHSIGKQKTRRKTELHFAASRMGGTLVYIAYSRFLHLLF